MEYQELFNNQYINEQIYRKLREEQFVAQQQQEFGKMLKALNDFMDSYSKIAPQYQKQAFDACAFEICKRLYGNK